MNRISFHILTLVFAGLLTVSCTEMITNVDLPVVDPKLVVNAWIQPGDSMLRATLTHSWPISKPHNWSNNPDVTHATVRISNGSQSVQLLYDAMDRSYRAPAAGFSLNPGTSCTLTASASGYPDINGTTRIPALTDVDMQFIGVKKSYDEDWGGDILRYSFKIKDAPGQENFYRVYMEVSYQNDTAFDDYYFRDPENVSSVFSDVNKDGEEILVNFVDGFQDYPYYVRFVVLTTDPAYYYFHKSIFSFTGEDPFAEPVQIYSNIHNGLGAIGSFLTHKKLVRIR